MRHSLLIATAFAVGCSAPAEPPPVDTTVQKAVIPDTDTGGYIEGTTFNGVSFVSYVGTDGRINVMRRISGSWFKTILDEWVTEEAEGVPLVVFDGKLFMVWVGRDDQRSINLRWSLDGQSWPDNQKWVLTNDQHFRVPALVDYGSRLNVFVRVPGGLKQYIFTSAGLEASGVEPGFPDYFRLSAAPVGNDLVMAWRLRDEPVHARKFVPGQGWSVAASINLWEDGDLVKNSASTAVFVGRADPSVNIGPRQIFFDSTSDGFNYQYLTNSPETTDYKPAAVRVGTSSADYAFINDGSGSLSFNSLTF
jgi:hypothetical protein